MPQKTGSSSIARAIYDGANSASKRGEILWDGFHHAALPFYEALGILDEPWDCFVTYRDPYDRLSSMWRFTRHRFHEVNATRIGIDPTQLDSVEEFIDWVSISVTKVAIADRRRLVTGQGRHHPDRHLCMSVCPCSWFAGSIPNTPVIVKGSEVLSLVDGSVVMNVGHTNVSKGPDILSEELRHTRVAHMIEAVYAEDFDALHHSHDT
jgi:hypothetical protein